MSSHVEFKATCERIFAWVDNQGEYCFECDMRECTSDYYGTGDSPMMCECIADDYKQCYGVEVELIENRSKWFLGGAG